MELVLIRSQSFWMGSCGYEIAEEPRHRVIISNDFYLGKTPVTQEQFAQCGVPVPTVFSQPDLPVTGVSWENATAYCAWLNEKKPSWGTRIPHNYEFCLPSEAQWECACRAGQNTEYWSGDGEAALASVGWYGLDAKTGSKQRVGWKVANAYGLYDMHGNVWEWCADVFDEHAYKKRPSDWNEEDVGGGHPYHVLRGGSWRAPASSCRSAFRFWRGKDYREDNVGFRVCLSISDSMI